MADELCLLGAGVSREFRVVRDNRVNPAKNREWKPASPKAKPEVEKTDINVPQKGYASSYILSLSSFSVVDAHL